MAESRLSYVDELRLGDPPETGELPLLELSREDCEATIDRMVVHRDRVQRGFVSGPIDEALKTLRAGGSVSSDLALRLGEANLWDLIGLAWIVNREFGPQDSGKHLCTGSYGLGEACPQGCSMCSFSSRAQEKMLLTHPDFQRTPGQFVAEAERQVAAARAHNPDAKIAFKVTHIGEGLRGNRKLQERYVAILKAVRQVGGIDFVDACLGLLDRDSAEAIAPYVDKYNNNLERIQRANEAWITDKHSLDDKIQTLKLAKGAGMGVCSGVIFGGGETLKDKADILTVLRSLVADGVVDSSPVNAFVPIYPSDWSILSSAPEDDVTIGLCLARIMLPRHPFFPNAGRFRYGKLLPAMHAVASGYSSHNNYLTRFVSPETDSLIRRRLEAVH